MCNTEDDFGKLKAHLIITWLIGLLYNNGILQQLTYMKNG